MCTRGPGTSMVIAGGGAQALQGGNSLKSQKGRGESVANQGNSNRRNTRLAIQLDIDVDKAFYCTEYNSWEGLCTSKYRSHLIFLVSGPRKEHGGPRGREGGV